MECRANVDGLDVMASYSDWSVVQTFLPLLRYLGELSYKKGSRVLAMLAASPAAGKSTSGMPRAEAEAFVERSDLYNARTVLAHTASSDLMLRLLANGECVRVS